jgi:Ca-activated chloride channel family protein
MEFERDYYAILGIPSGADEQIIKRAYRQLARRYHPDVSTEEQAPEHFREIQEAYELLLDPIQREAYDHWRKQQGLDRPLPLILRVTPSHSVLPCLGEPQVLYVLVELLAADTARGQRLPINLCLVLDRSTSMKGTRLHQVKEAARHIVDQMEPDDVLSIIAFSDRAQVVLAGRRRIDQATARAAISSIRSGGGTEIFQGLKLGLEQVERWHTPDSISHLILLTDGQTYGDEDDCRGVARLAGERQIPITTMGIGSDWNDKLLDEIASLSRAPGSSMYIDSTEKIAQAFHDQISGLGSTFAHHLSLSIHQSEGVSLKEMFQVSPHINQLFSVDDKVALGSLEAQHPQAVIMELLVGSHTPGTHRLIHADVEGIVPALSGQPVRIRQAVEVSFVTDLDRRAPLPPDIVSAMGKLTIFRMQERVMREIEVGQIESAVNRLKTMATRLLDIGEADLARAALLEAGRLAQTGTLSAEGRKKLRYGTRELRILPKEVRYD